MKRLTLVFEVANHIPEPVVGIRLAEVLKHELPHGVVLAEIKYHLGTSGQEVDRPTANEQRLTWAPIEAPEDVKGFLEGLAIVAEDLRPEGHADADHGSSSPLSEGVAAPDDLSVEQEGRAGVERCSFQRSSGGTGTRYRWTFRTDMGVTVSVIDTSVLDAETRALDLSCASHVNLISIEEVEA